MNENSRIPNLLLRWGKVLLAILIGVPVLVLLIHALQARARLPDLQPWHRIVLNEEFAAARPGAPDTFEEYLALEKRLFREMQSRVLESPVAADAWELGRYNPDSVVSKLSTGTPWNHSFELTAQGEPQGAVLLVHGLTDSPYSLRDIAETFQAQGFHVVALRLPGHGTLPSGLVGTSWKDWYAATVLAAKYAATKAGEGKSFIAVGYSTGSALLALYSIRSLDDPALPRPADLHLVSSAIGISPFAVLTNILSGLAFLPAFEKSRWLDVLPEYDPYKYNSFPVNAASQIYNLTRAVQDELQEHTADQLAAMPRVHVYHSIVDSTVTASEVITGLLAHLAPGRNELIVFDINRQEAIESLIAPAQRESIALLRSAAFPFRLTLIANRDRNTRRVAAFVREEGASGFTTAELPLEWPLGVFSVGHVALPMPPDDPVYGLTPPATEPRFNLGSISARGEEGALVVGLGTFARLRSNPFYEVIRANLIATHPAAAPPPAPPSASAPP